MKYLYTALLLALTFSPALSQLLDHEDITLPWETIYIKNCGDATGDPILIVDPSEVYTSFVDSMVYDQEDNCTSILRSHYLFDWESQIGDSSFIQNFIVSSDLTLEVKELFFLPESDVTAPLDIQSLIIDPKEDYTYSFRMDTLITEVDLDIALGDAKDFFIYDWTEKSVQQATVQVVACENEPIIESPELVEFTLDKEYFTSFDIDLFQISVDYECSDYNLEIIEPQEDPFIIVTDDIGTIKEYVVAVNFTEETPFRVLQTIQLEVKGEKPDPFKVCLENKDFVAGESTEIDIWSNALNNVGAWEFRLRINNAQYLDATGVDNFDESLFSIQSDNTELRGLWVMNPPSAEIVNYDIQDEETWVTMEIVPEFNGTTEDLFILDSVEFTSVYLDDGEDLYSYKLDFNFDVCEKNILNVQEAIDPFPFKIFPNPVSDHLTIQFNESEHRPDFIEIYNQLGQKVLAQEYTNHQNATIHIGSLPSGVYTLALKGKDQASKSMRKFVKH